MGKKKVSFLFIIVLAAIALLTLSNRAGKFGKIDDWQYQVPGEFDLTMKQVIQEMPFGEYWHTYLLIFLVCLLTLILIFTFFRGLLIRIKNAKDPVLKDKGLRKIYLGLPTTFFVFAMVSFVYLLIHDSFSESEDTVLFLVGGISIFILVLLATMFAKGLYFWTRNRGDENRKKWGRKIFFYAILNTLAIMSGPIVIALLLMTSASSQNTYSYGYGAVPGNSSAGWGAAPTGVPSSMGDSLLGNLGNLSGSTNMSETVGLSVGGAKDINNFRENIKNGFLPLPTDVTYEGLFYDYLFDTGVQDQCQKLFCPSYTSAISKDPFSGKDDYLLSVGLNSGMQQKDFARKKLNLIIVLDISGSMDSPFDRYYYDQLGVEPSSDGEEKEMSKTKMQVASESAVALLGHLNPEDSFGMVLFDDYSYLAKPLRKIGDTDMEAIKGHILEIQSQGSTNMSAGMTEATDQFGEYLNADSDEYENRIIFLTDAQPNTGDISDTGMLSTVKKNADNKIYTTFIGIGVDFNTELIESITEVKGANYYSVHSPSEFKKRMDEGFDYMVTPLVFDLKLTVNAPGFKIEEVYGSPEADEATGEIMKVNTLFPSERVDGETRGGLVLLHMKRISDDNTIELSASYKDRSGREDGSSARLEFEKKPEYYDNTGVRKGIVLSRYKSLLNNWLLDERSLVQGQKIVPIPDNYHTTGIPVVDAETVLGKWERNSEKLSVSSAYKKTFAEFIPYFEKEMNTIGDQSMTKELDILRLLSSYGS